MRFGPLGAEGGERRLNVLISRAKRRCEVFSSITDEDIDLDRAKGKGVFAFKLFLHYARTGRLSVAQASGREADSVFEEQVASALQARGYQVHPQVGIAGFFLRSAIADPERPADISLALNATAQLITARGQPETATGSVKQSLRITDGLSTGSGASTGSSVRRSSWNALSRRSKPPRSNSTSAPNSVAIATGRCPSRS